MYLSVREKDEEISVEEIWIPVEAALMSSGHHLSYHILSLLLPHCRSQSSSRVPVVLLAKK
jgi:hypothetical protein